MLKWQQIIVVQEKWGWSILHTLFRHLENFWNMDRLNFLKNGPVYITQVVHITHILCKMDHLVKDGPVHFSKVGVKVLINMWSILPKICTKRTIFGIWTGPF